MKLLFKLKAWIAGILFIFWTLLASVTITIASLLKWRPGADFIFRNWGRGGCLLFGIKIKKLHFDRLEREKGVLFLFNHQSHVDILIMSASVPKSFRFGAKIELFKIPLFGFAMKAAGTLPIARQNRAEVFKVYKEAELRLRNGESFALAPEGTRQLQPEIGPFKKGPFVFALGAHAPVQPVVILGAHEILKKNKIFPNDNGWSKTVYVALGKVTDTSARLEGQLDLLKDSIRAETIEIYNELRQKAQDDLSS